MKIIDYIRIITGQKHGITHYPNYSLMNLTLFKGTFLQNILRILQGGEEFWNKHAGLTEIGTKFLPLAH